MPTNGFYDISPLMHKLVDPKKPLSWIHNGEGKYVLHQHELMDKSEHLKNPIFDKYIGQWKSTALPVSVSNPKDNPLHAMIPVRDSYSPGIHPHMGTPMNQPNETPQLARQSHLDNWGAIHDKLSNAMTSNMLKAEKMQRVELDMELFQKALKSNVNKA